MLPLRQPGLGDDCSGALADASTTEDMVLAEQRSDAALQRAVPGPSAAREAAEAAQVPFEAEIRVVMEMSADAPRYSCTEPGPSRS